MMMWPSMMWGLYGGGLGITGIIISSIFTVLIIAGIIILIVWLIKRAGSYGTVRTEGEALEILKKRYARGEITKKEFENIKKDIS